MTEETNGEDPVASRRQWKGFSDYRDVAAKIHEDVNKAIDAFAHLDSKRKQGVGITPKTAVNTRTALLKITKRLYVEVRKNKDAGKVFEEVYERWHGEDGDGYVAQLEESNFLNGPPEFLSELIEDIIDVAWELGYIKAGVEQPADPTTDTEAAKAMFE